MKRLDVLAALLLLLALLSGCGDAANRGEPASEDLQRLALLEVYTAEGAFAGSTRDKALLSQFNSFEGKIGAADDSDARQVQLQNELEERLPLYTIVAYKTPASILNDGTLEKSVTITLYEQSNIIKEEIAGETIKAFSVPAELLTVYTSVSDDQLAFYRSLAEDTGEAQASSDGGGSPGE